VDVKTNSGLNTRYVMEKPTLSGEKPEKTGKKP
jgi:hypothetical protein